MLRVAHLAWALEIGMDAEAADACFDYRMKCRQLADTGRRRQQACRRSDEAMIHVHRWPSLACEQTEPETIAIAS